MILTDSIIQLNRSQSEHILKHSLQSIYSFKLMSYMDGSSRYEELVKEDLEDDFSLPDMFEEFKAEFHGENRSSKMVQFEKLIRHIK